MIVSRGFRPKTSLLRTSFPLMGEYDIQLVLHNFGINRWLAASSLLN